VSWKGDVSYLNWHVIFFGNSLDFWYCSLILRLNYSFLVKKKSKEQVLLDILRSGRLMMLTQSHSYKHISYLLRKSQLISIISQLLLDSSNTQTNSKQIKIKSSVTEICNTLWVIRSWKNFSWSTTNHQLLTHLGKQNIGNSQHQRHLRHCSTSFS